MFVAESHWCRTLASAILSKHILSGFPLGHPVVSLCHGDFAALDLQSWPYHVLPQFINVDLGELTQSPGSRPGL